MANEQNLTPFKKGQVTIGAGRPKGSKNRRTIISEWLAVQSEEQLPDGTKSRITQEDKIVLAMIAEAQGGNVNAAAFLFDGKHGKVASIQVNEPPKPFIDYGKYSNDELQQLELLLRKGMPDPNGGIQEAEVIA